MQEIREAINFCEISIPNIQTLSYVNFKKSHSPLKLHTHPNQFEICFHDTGAQTYIIDGKEYRTNGGDILVSFPNETDSTGSYCEEKSALYYMIFELNQSIERFLEFDETETEYLLQSLLGIKRRQFPASIRIKEILNRVFSVYKSNHPLRIGKIRALMTELFCELIDCSGCEKRTVPNDIQRVIHFLNQHPDLNFKLCELAEIACLSLPRFKQKFKEITGFPPMEYADRLKIELAKRLLSDNKSTITEISYDLGFSSSQHFSSVFKKHTTFTPRQFRKLN